MRYTLLTLTILLAFGLGYAVARKSIKPEIKTVETVRREVQYVDRVSTRTVTKDGETKVVVQERTVTQDATTTAVETAPEKLPELPRYTVGAARLNSRDWQLSLGARLGDLPVFVEVGATTHLDYFLGLRYEF